MHARGAGATNWPVFRFDPARSGFNSAEHTLTVGNVHRLRERWQIALGAVADSTPILLDKVALGRAEVPMLFQTTTNGVTLGIDATSGKIVWRFTTHGSTVTDSTPAADPSGTSIYVPGIDGKVHKVSAAKGREARARRAMQARNEIIAKRRYACAQSWTTQGCVASSIPNR